ncbi:MAG: hypothetical protein Fur0018_11390 [Anaerolineales bacterium]
MRTGLYFFRRRSHEKGTFSLPEWERGAFLTPFTGAGGAIWQNCGMIGEDDGRQTSPTPNPRAAHPQGAPPKGKERT